MRREVGRRSSVLPALPSTLPHQEMKTEHRKQKTNNKQIPIPSNEVIRDAGVCLVPMEVTPFPRSDTALCRVFPLSLSCALSRGYATAFRDSAEKNTHTHFPALTLCRDVV